MEDEYMDYRCPECDARYCGVICHASDPGYAYAVGTGYVPLDRAWEMLDSGQTVRVDWPASRVEMHRRWPDVTPQYQMPASV